MYGVRNYSIINYKIEMENFTEELITLLKVSIR